MMTTAKWFSVEDPTAQERLAAAWADAPLRNLEVLTMLLEVARTDVITYAPAPAELGEGEPEPDPPMNYVYAQLQQTINLWNAGRVDAGGVVGDEGFSFTPRPLDKTIRKIIRPVDGRPHVL